MFVRITGTVQGTETKSGVKNDRAWSMRVTRILFADLDFSEVVLNDQDPTPAPGDRVDWVVRIESRGAFLSVQRFGDYKDSREGQTYAAPSLAYAGDVPA